MKKLSIVLALVLMTGGAFAQKACCKKGAEHGGKACCKKEAAKDEAKHEDHHEEVSMAGGHKACCKKGGVHGTKACCKKGHEERFSEAPMRERNVPMERAEASPTQK